MRKILYILSLLLFSRAACADGEVFATGNIDFGKFVQVGKSSTVVITPQSDRVLVSGAVGAFSPYTHSGTVTTYATTNSYDEDKKEIEFNDNRQSDLGYCAARISDIKFSDNIVTTSEGSKTISIGATLNINGYCKEGVYRGSIDVNYQVKDGEEVSDEMVRVLFSFEIEEPLSVSKMRGGSNMDFGMYITPSITPSEQAYVTINPSDCSVSSTNNIARVGGSSTPCASVAVSGVSERKVSAIFDATSMYIYLNGDTENSSKLLVDQFNIADCTTSDGKTFNFSLPASGDAQASKTLKVGARLTVPGGTAAGTYTGSINITFIYNDYY